MPSKRTNDSVDRILEELSHEQAERGIRDSVTDRQVDAILQSLGHGSMEESSGGGSASRKRTCRISRWAKAIILTPRTGFPPLCWTTCWAICPVCGLPKRINPAPLPRPAGLLLCRSRAACRKLSLK